VFFCLLKILRAVQRHHPAQTLLVILLLGPFNEWCLEVTPIYSLVVLITGPLVYTTLSLNVSLDVSELHEGIDCGLKNIKVNHLVVAVFGDLVQDGCP